MSAPQHTDADAESISPDAVSPLGARYVESETFECDDADPCASVVRRVASFAGVDPLTADGVLYDAIDAELVERTVEGHGDAEFRLTFRLFGCDVELESGGQATAYRRPTRVE